MGICPFQEEYELWQINDISVTLSILWVSHTPSRNQMYFLKKKFARVKVAKEFCYTACEFIL